MRQYTGTVANQKAVDNTTTRINSIHLKSTLFYSQLQFNQFSVIDSELSL